jgi:crotonobetainyl-CoA:carnitine CoA-transferase CaiB-like acyl-CoA transferase
MGSRPAVSGLPLAGLRVLDFTHAAAGPYATMFLADMGAEVLKVERPQGDGGRTMGAPMPSFPPRNSEYYLSINRNKRGIVLDLSSPRAVELAIGLAEKSDIVVQNFRPGVMERLGLSYDRLRAVRRGLIFCSISAFGEEGPWSRRPANDIIMQSVSGLMGVTGEVEGGPVRIGAPVSDYSTGLFALSGILAALHVRDEHPEGQHVRVSMLEASLNLLANYIPSVADLHARIPRLGRGHAQIVPYQAFACADGEYVMVGAFTRNFWLNLCSALGHEEWKTDPKFATNSARLLNREELVRQLAEIFLGKRRDHWLEVLDQADVPASPVLELHDTLGLEQVKHDGTLIELEEDGRLVSVVRSPVRVQEWDEAPRKMPPDLGRDTADVLTDVLGLDETEIAELASRGIAGVQGTSDKGVK